MLDDKNKVLEVNVNLKTKLALKHNIKIFGADVKKKKVEQVWLSCDIL